MKPLKITAIVALFALAGIVVYLLVDKIKEKKAMAAALDAAGIQETAK